MKDQKTFTEIHTRTVDPHFIMISGFLGAGKTTAIIRLANWLRSKKALIPGIITNDQGVDLIDTALAKDTAHPTTEITGGCFCCRSDALIAATDKLTSDARPDVFIAEPVGSCTDLIATVSIPLKTIYNRNFQVAPLSTIVDPLRALRILRTPSTNEPRAFSPDIEYIYLKQIEEAQIIVINKSDTLTTSKLETLRDTIRERYPSVEILTVAARQGTGLEQWFELLLHRSRQPTTLLDVDYARYGNGEARLGWFNGKYGVAAHSGLTIDANELLTSIVESIRNEFIRGHLEVAHLKATVTAELSETAEAPIATIQWVATQSAPEFTQTATNSVVRATLLLNVRAEVDPVQIAATVEVALSRLSSFTIAPLNVNYFRPGQPTPLYRATATDF